MEIQSREPNPVTRNGGMGYLGQPSKEEMRKSRPKLIVGICQSKAEEERKEK